MPTVLIVGASGMLGYTLLRHLPASGDFEVHGTLRGPALPGGQLPPRDVQLHHGLDVTQPNTLFALIDQLRPQAVINCVGLIKQLDKARRPVAAVEINALFPHRLAEHCNASGCRLIHFSTDCVFAGTRGGYREADLADADDLYGRSKRLGEVDCSPHLTLRTSLIGHELASHFSLVDWFLSRREPVCGYAGAVFSGLPTVEIARVLARHILPDRELQGLYHLSAEPIDKDRLLRLIGRIYHHDIPVTRTELPRIDRSLDSSRLREATGYAPANWEQLVELMHEDYLSAYAGIRLPNGEAQ
jgi:dTDP-4-dehydrorhamnose reductase